MENKYRWSERILLVIASLVLGMFFNTYTDIGKFSIRIDRLEDQIKVTVNNDQMVQEEDIKEIRKALSDMKAQLIGYMNFRDDSEMYDYEAYLLWRWENDDKFKNLNDGNTEMGS